MTGYVIGPLDEHDRKSFVSGSEPLDRYFRERVTQDVRRRLTSCFVAVADDGVAGFYTLAATSIAFAELAPERAKRLPRYPVVPAVLLGRLAIARHHQGKRLGSALVADAILRSTRSDVVAYAMLVDAKDETVAKFYEHLGFERLPSNRLRLIRPL